jgi:hypothetical protein
MLDILIVSVTTLYGIILVLGFIAAVETCVEFYRFRRKLKLWSRLRTQELSASTGDQSMRRGSRH